MKYYEYVEVVSQKFLGAEIKEHKQIIAEYASKGFRYVGWIPTRQTDHGKIQTLDLIFEKDIED